MAPSTVLPAFQVVLNPAAGQADAQRLRAVLAQVFEAAGRDWAWVPVAGTRGLPAACQAAAARAAGEGGVLVAVGGDGTLNTVARAALGQGCPVGVIPQGTFNYFARAHGIPQDAQAAARALLRAQPQPVQVGLANGRLFLVNASLGLHPRLLLEREVRQARWGRRRWVAPLSYLATLAGWRHRLRLDIEADGRRAQRVTAALFIGNNRLQLERLGLRPDVVMPVGHGEMAGLVLRPMPGWALLGVAMRAALGRLDDGRDVESFSLRRLTVGMPGPWRVRVALDGEVGRMAPPLVFEVSPTPLLLMRPLPQDRVAPG